MTTIPRLERFADLEDALAALTDYEKELAYRYTGKTFDLSRMEALLDRLGRPEKRCGTLVHVAGTKGKGSTSATCAALLRAGGAGPVGLYTSPHLVHLQERIRLDGRVASDDAWLAAARAVIPAAIEQGERPTFFEVTTAMAFEAFARAGCGASVLEVGLGGRLDATNVLSRAPLAACVVTRIGYDHVALLGKTLDAIAREKAAIARPGVPLVVAGQEPEALSAIEDVARRVSAPIERLGRELRVEVERASLEGTRFSVETPRGSYRALETPLVGRHQAENAAVAIAAAELALAGRGPLDEAFRRGLPGVRWRGRFDLCRRTDGASVLIDGAHDATSTRRLVEAVREVLPGARPLLLFAIARDKEIDRILDELPADLIPAAVTCRARTKRAAEPADLAGRLARRGIPAVAHEGDAAGALRLARERAGAAGLVLSTGSLYLAGEVLDALGEGAE